MATKKTQQIVSEMAKAEASKINAKPSAKVSQTRTGKPSHPKLGKPEPAPKPAGPADLVMDPARKFPKQGTIGWIVLTTMARNPKVSSDELGEAIRKNFPESKWSKAHYSWYRYQVKKGRYYLPECKGKVRTGKSKASKPAPLPA